MHYNKFNIHCNHFNKHYNRFPKLPAKTCKPNQLPWRICVYTVSHYLTTTVIILSTATSCRLVVHINAVHLPTAHTRGGSDKRSCLAKSGTWLDMYHILNEPPASVKRREHSKHCILPAVYDVHNKHKFSLKNGTAVLNYPTRLFEAS